MIPFQSARLALPCLRLNGVGHSQVCSRFHFCPPTLIDGSPSNFRFLLLIRAETPCRTNFVVRSFICLFACLFVCVGVHVCVPKLQFRSSARLDPLFSVAIRHLRKTTRDFHRSILCKCPTPLIRKIRPLTCRKFSPETGFQFSSQPNANCCWKIQPFSAGNPTAVT